MVGSKVERREREKKTRHKEQLALGLMMGRRTPPRAIMIDTENFMSELSATGVQVGP